MSAGPGGILLVDDHALFREGLVLTLQKRSGAPLHIAATGAQALQQLRNAADIGLVLMDYYLADMPGDELVARMVACRPEVRILVLSASDDPRDGEAALAAGAAGFLHKSADSETLINAVERVLRGERMRQFELPAAVPGGMRAEDLAIMRLTQRQREVLCLLCQGLRNGEIAARLATTEKTVKTHVSAIFATLDVPNRTQAVLIAMRSPRFAEEMRRKSG